MLRQPRVLVPFGFERRVFRNILLKVLFSTNQAAPFTGTYAGEVGYLKGTDTNSVISAASSQLTVNGTPATSDGLISCDSGGTIQKIPRAGGRTLTIKMISRTTIPAGSLPRFGLSSGDLSSNAIDIGCAYSSKTSANVRDGGSNLRSGVLNSANEHDFAFVMRATGGRVIVKDGTGTPKLAWIYSYVASDLYAKLRCNNAAAQNYVTDDWQVFDTPALAGDWDDASVHVTPSVSGTTYSAQTSGLHQLAFTLPGTPSAGLVAVELRYRVQDGSNYWTCYVKRNAGNSAWDVLVDSVSAGVATNRKTVTGVGTPTRLIVYVDANAHDSYSEEAAAATVRGSTVNNSALNTQTLIAAVWDASTTIGALDSFPLTNSLYDGLFT